MTDRYYDRARQEIMPWLPRNVSRLLDVGCGSGETTAALKESFAIAWVGGVECAEAAAARAEKRFDRLWHGDAATTPFEVEIPPASLDLVLCLDVLEHMPDPWSLVKRLSPLLAPAGRLIVSVPNVRHWKFVGRLLFFGDFVYRDAGLLDRTHLRFFVRSTAIELATCGGLRCLKAVPAQRWRVGEPRWTLRGSVEAPSTSSRRSNGSS